MTKITAYKSDDGSLHENEVDAIKADAKYWKRMAQEPPPKSSYITQPGDPDHHYSYERGHQ